MNDFIMLEEIGDNPYPNHTYILKNKTSGKMIGYIPHGQTKPILFVKPLSFDKRKRKFKEIK